MYVQLLRQTAQYGIGKTLCEMLMITQDDSVTHHESYSGRCG